MFAGSLVLPGLFEFRFFDDFAISGFVTIIGLASSQIDLRVP
jgi:hypothetical protein